MVRTLCSCCFFLCRIRKRAVKRLHETCSNMSKLLRYCCGPSYSSHSRKEIEESLVKPRA